MRFTESSAVEQMIPDSASSFGSGAGNSELHEDPLSGWGDSLGEEFEPVQWTLINQAISEEAARRGDLHPAGNPAHAIRGPLMGQCVV